MSDLVLGASGQMLECWTEGPADALTVLFVSGTPSSGRHPRAVVEAATAQGWRSVSFARPGYGRSSPAPGRSVADFVADARFVLDAYGVGDFVVAGWSGGGPHALACAALLPDRCRAAAVVAGVAPYPASGLDWFAGMGADNLEEFGAALSNESALLAYLEPQVATLATVTGAELAAALGDLVPAADLAVLGGPFADELAASFRDAVSSGVAGWRDDDIAFTKPWGFALDAIAVPVTIWQGGVDRMVPAGHGEWLSEHIPGARLQRLASDGHLTLIAARMPEILADLAGSIT